jgi:hypothetical protein
MQYKWGNSCLTIKTTTTVAREEVNDRPGGGRRQVEWNTASHAAWYTPFWRRGSGNYSVLRALHEPVCHKRQQATVLFVVRVNNLECTEFGDIIKSWIQKHHLNEVGCRFFSIRETNNRSGNPSPTYRDNVSRKGSASFWPFSIVRSQQTIWGTRNFLQMAVFWALIFF